MQPCAQTTDEDMSDKVDIKVNLDVEVNELEEARALRREFELMDRELSQLGRDLKAFGNPMATIGRMRGKIGADAVQAGREAIGIEGDVYTNLRKRFAFEKRMAAQRKAQDTDAARQVRDDSKEIQRVLRDQLAFSARMSRQRAQAEAAAEAETRREISATAKMRDRETRKAISDAKALERARTHAASQARAGAGQIRSGAGRIAGTAAATGAVAGYGLERAVERGVSTRADIDEQETNLKIFSDTDDGKGGRRKITDADIRKLRRGPAGLDQLAIGTGNTVADTLRAYSESSKAGLIDPIAQTRNILKAGSALELDTSKTTKLTGTLARNLGSKATPDRMFSILNAIGVGAREDPTQSDEIVEGLNRSQGLLSMSKGFTPEDLVAMVSGGQSVGVQPGKAGTSITALASSILQGGNKFVDPKKRKELNFAAKNLGFGSAKNMAAQFAGENGKAVYYQIMKGLQGMAPQLRQQVADALSGGQWSDEDLQIVQGIDGQINTDREIHDPKNANFINEASTEKMKSWKMLWQQYQTIFSLFCESFGKGFDGVLREINGFFRDLHSKFNYDQVSQYVRDALDGLRQGLGFENWKQALEAIFPSNIGGLGRRIGEFSKGFASGIRQIAGAVSSVATVFTGSGASAETVGRLAGQFLSLGVACVALAPVMGVIGGVASLVLGIVGIARAAAGVLGIGAAAAGAGGGAVAGALAGVAKLMSGGFILGLAGAIGSMRGPISTLILDAVRPMVQALWDGLKSAFSLEGLKAGGKALLNEVIPAPLQRWLDGDTPKPTEGTTGWVDPPTRAKPAEQAPAEKLKSEQEKQTQILEDSLKVQREALRNDKSQALADSAKKSPASAITSSINDSARQASSSVMSGTVGNVGGGGSSGGPLADTGMRRNGIIGGGGAPTNAQGAGGSDTASPDQKSGGSRSWRNNNPGNIEFGPFAKSMGAIGSDGRFAKFPSYEAGRKAQEKLLFESKGYKDLTLSGAIRRWAPASENNVPAYLKAMGGDPGKRMSEYSPEQRGRLLDAMQQHEGWKVGTVRGGGGGGGGNVAGSATPGSAAGAVDTMSRFLGQNEYRDRGTLSKFVGHDVAGSVNAWCARMVNASLASVGIRGTGSPVANSYQKWGIGVDPKDVAKGDVLLDTHGKGYNQTGGHVGMSTGQTRVDPRTGKLQLERIAGNQSDNVAKTWVDADRLMVRRAQESIAQSKALAQDAARSKTPTIGGQSAGAGVGSSGSPAGLGQLDVAPPRSGGLGQSTPLRVGGGGAAGAGGGGRVGHTINAPISISGHNQSPEELANTVQRKLQDSMNRRTHDYDGFA